MDQKKFWSNTLGPKIPKIFLVIKIICQKKFESKNFGSKKILIKKSVLKIFWSKKNYGKRILGTKKIGNVYLTMKNTVKEYLVHKTFGQNKKFGYQNWTEPVMLNWGSCANGGDIPEERISCISHIFAIQAPKNVPKDSRDKTDDLHSKVQRNQGTEFLGRFYEK